MRRFALIAIALVLVAWHPGAGRRKPMLAPAPPDVTAPIDGASLTLNPGTLEIALSWDAASDPGGIDHYEVRFATGSTAPATCNTGSAATGCSDPISTSCTHTGLDENTEYSYRVCAVDRAGNMSAGITASAFPDDTTLPTDGTAIVFTVGDGQLVLDWGNATDNRSVDHYEVRMTSGSETSPADCSSGSTVTGCSDPTASNCTATGLTNMTSYAFRVCAVDPTGNQSSGLTDWQQPYIDLRAYSFDGVDEYCSAADSAEWDCDDEDAATLIIILRPTTCVSGLLCDDFAFSREDNTDPYLAMEVQFNASGYAMRDAVEALGQFEQYGPFTMSRWTGHTMRYDGSQGTAADRLNHDISACDVSSPPSCGTNTAQTPIASLGTIPATLSDETSVLLAGGVPAGGFSLAGDLSEAAYFCNVATATEVDECLYQGTGQTKRLANLGTLSKRTSGGRNCASQIFTQFRAWYRFGDGDTFGTLTNRAPGSSGGSMTCANMESGDDISNGL